MNSNVEEGTVKIEEIYLPAIKVEFEDGVYLDDCKDVNMVEASISPNRIDRQNSGTYSFSTADSKVKIENAADCEIKIENVDASENMVEDRKADLSSSLDYNYDLDYNGYHPKYPILTHFLNNNIPNTFPEWKLETVPCNVLEIRETSSGKGVFALMTLSENCIFGPFEGLIATESANGYTWKIKDGKLLNTEMANWMQYVTCSPTASLKNLEMFQFDGSLYFQTNREINAGEELLIYYKEEETQRSDNGEDGYYVPIIQTTSQNIFACTICSLGLSSAEYLIKHKVKCIHTDYDVTSEDIIQCEWCNIWLERRENQDHHQSYCLQNSSRKSRHPLAIDINQLPQLNKLKEVKRNCRNIQASPDEIQIDNAYVIKMKEHVQSLQQLNCTDRSDFITLNEEEKFKCEVCKKYYKSKATLNKHIKYLHTKRSEQKWFKCSECSYETYMHAHLKRHLITHFFECNTCKMKFKLREDLQSHRREKHPKDGVKQYEDQKDSLDKIQANVTNNIVDVFS